jgi:hypothetical protein
VIAGAVVYGYGQIGWERVDVQLATPQISAAASA